MGALCFAESALAKIHLPNDLDHLDTQTFAYCKGLTEVSGLDNVRCIGFGAFEGCASLTELHFKSVDTIMNGAFAGCRNLERLELGNGVSWLDSFLFSGCASLRELELRGSFDKLEKDTFANASSLQYLTIETSAETFSFPSGGFRDTRLAEMTLLGDFEPLVEDRDSFPESIVFKVHGCFRPQHVLGYTYEFQLTQDPSSP